MDDFNIKMTAHTGRTIMFTELSKLMDHAVDNDSYIEFLQQNIANKNTKSNQDETTKRLQKLYVLDVSYLPFKAFKYFWQIIPANEKQIITLLYAISHDYLLAESIPVVVNTNIDDRVQIEKFEDNIKLLHPDHYSANTLRSSAQNLASSWKQAGFITGKVKNIRTKPEIGYHSIAFAFIMAYFNGERGDYIINSKWVKALAMNETAIRTLALEAAKRDLLQYQYAGNVTTVSFSTLFKKMNIDGI